MPLDEQKEKLLDEWLAVRNAILRATEGQMRVTYNRETVGEGGESSIIRESDDIKGVFIELALIFPEPLKLYFTDEERAAVEKAISDDVGSE